MLIIKTYEEKQEEIRLQEINTKIAEAKAYLASTDFYMTVDKYAELDEARKVELTTKRAEARELINTLEAELATIEVTMANSKIRLGKQSGEARAFVRGNKWILI